jgi:chemotaxis protein CheZ
MTSRSAEPEDDTGITRLDETETLGGRPAGDPAIAARPLIAEAIGQLFAVVEMTEAAANQIMDACDTLTARGGEIGAAAEDQIKAQIKQAVRTILEACGFQDLTGQRVAKAVKSLRLLDTRLADPARTRLTGAGPDHAGDAASHGLQGLSRSDVAIDQSAADRLFAQSS